MNTTAPLLAALLLGATVSCQPPRPTPAKAAPDPFATVDYILFAAHPGSQPACPPEGHCGRIWIELTTPSAACIGWIAPSAAGPATAAALRLDDELPGFPHQESAFSTALPGAHTFTDFASGIRCGLHRSGEISGRLTLPTGQATLRLPVGNPSSPDLPDEHWLREQAYNNFRRAVRLIRGEPLVANAPVPRAFAVRTSDQHSAEAFLRPNGICWGRLDRSVCHAALFAGEDAILCANAADRPACLRALEKISGWRDELPYAVIIVEEGREPQLLIDKNAIRLAIAPHDTEDEALLSYAQRLGWEEARVAPLPRRGYYVVGSKGYSVIDRGEERWYGKNEDFPTSRCKPSDYPPWYSPELGRCEPLDAPALCSGYADANAVAWDCPLATLPELRPSAPPAELSLPPQAFESQIGEWEGGFVRRLSFPLTPHLAAGYLQRFGAEDAAICAQERSPLDCRKALFDQAKRVSATQGFNPGTWVLVGIVSRKDRREPMIEQVPAFVGNPRTELGAKLLAVRGMDAWTPAAWSATRVPRGWLIEGPNSRGQKVSVLANEGWAPSIDPARCSTPTPLPEPVRRALARLQLPPETPACEREDGRWELRSPERTQIISP